jgi:hypothetical protein
MSGPSHATADSRTTAKPHHVRQTWLAVSCLAAIAFLALALGPVFRLPAAKDCRLHPRPNLTPAAQAVTATSRGGWPCLITANNSDTRAEALHVVSPPRNGWIATRGATRLVYFPNASFKGVDMFDVELVRRTDTTSPLVHTITVRVKVD